MEWQLGCPDELGLGNVSIGKIAVLGDVRDEKDRGPYCQLLGDGA
jgi:hypothetical protein